MTVKVSMVSWSIEAVGSDRRPDLPRAGHGHPTNQLSRLLRGDTVRRHHTKRSGDPTGVVENAAGRSTDVAVVLAVLERVAAFTHGCEVEQQIASGGDRPLRISH